MTNQTHSPTTWTVNEVSRLTVEQALTFQALPTRLLIVGPHSQIAAEHWHKQLPTTEIHSLLQNPIKKKSWWRKQPCQIVPQPIGEYDALLINLVCATTLANALPALLEYLTTNAPVLVGGLGSASFAHLHDKLMNRPPWFEMHDLGDTLLRVGLTHPVIDTTRQTLAFSATDKLQNELASLDIPPLETVSSNAMQCPVEIITAHGFVGSKPSSALPSPIHFYPKN